MRRSQEKHRVRLAVRVRNHLLSNVVGYIALFVFAISGTATALPGTGTIDHDDLQRHVVHRGAIHDGAINSAKVDSSIVTRNRVLYATVKADGTLVRSRSRGAIRVETFFAEYIVQFNRNVRGCAYLAITGDPGATANRGQNDGIANASWSPFVGATDEVFVRTRDVDGNPEPKGFYLAVLC